MKTIVYAHPWEGSFNHAILETIKKELDKSNEPYKIIDLYKESFNPVFSPEELQMYSIGETPYEKVKEYKKIIADSSELIFIFPIWWYDMPAILKGFLDKVMLKKFAYSEENGEWTGLLTNITKVNVITTASMTKKDLVETGNAIQGVFLDSILTSLGISNQNMQWIHLGEITDPNNDNRIKFLESLKNYI